MKLGEQICIFIENSEFFKRFCLQSGWMSGSQTYVYPISDWVSDRQIDIQINSLVSHNGMTNSFKKLIKDINKEFGADTILNWWYKKNDGSCPQEYTLYYKEV